MNLYAIKWNIISRYIYFLFTSATVHYLCLSFTFFFCGFSFKFKLKDFNFGGNLRQWKFSIYCFNNCLLFSTYAILCLDWICRSFHHSLSSFGNACAKHETRRRGNHCYGFDIPSDWLVVHPLVYQLPYSPFPIRLTNSPIKLMKS